MKLTTLFMAALCLVVPFSTRAQDAPSPVSITSVQAFPNGRTSDDPPGNAIDGNTNTFTWSTASGSVASTAYLAVGFTNSAIHRLRLWKSRDGGGGGDVKNLDIQYTVETNTPLSARAWLNVRRLTNGFGGVELMNASAVNLDGSVTGDIHESASSGYASLTFEAVTATGLRIAFSNSSGSGFNHYRVGEIQVFSGDWTNEVFCASTPPNIVSWWPAEMGTSDVIGTNHGVVNGQVSYVPGKVGQGFQFDGVDDYLVASTNGLHFGTNDFSIEGWIKSTSTKTWNVICSFDNYSPAIYLLGDGRIQIYPSGGSLEAGYNDGQFHHFAVVRRAGEVTYYKDGVTNGVVGYAGDLKPLTFVIGWDYFSGDQFPGVIDELALYSRALTIAEVQGVFAAGAAGKCSGAPPNVLPIVSLTGPTNGTVVYLPSAVSFSATATDFDGTVATVEFLNGTNVIGAVTNPPFNFSWTNPLVGDLLVSARAIDDKGAAGVSGNVNLKVFASNLPPTISLTLSTNPVSFLAPAVIPLKATASDSEGSVVRVEFLEGTNVLGSHTAAPFEFYVLHRPAGNYSFTARAIDNAGGASVSSAVTVTVSARTGTVTNALLGPGDLGAYRGRNFEALLFTVTGQTSSGSVWGTDVYTDDSTLSLAAVHAGALTNGQTGVVQVTMLPGLSQYIGSTRNGVSSAGWSAFGGSFAVSSIAGAIFPPTVTLTSPTNNAVFQDGSLISLTATASDSDGTVVRVEFYSGTTLLGSAANAPYTFKVVNATAGLYSVTAKAIDNQGATATSAAVTVIVNAAPTVSLTNPTNNTVVLAPATIQLAATAADSDGTIARVEFLDGTTMIGSDTTSPYSFTYANVAAGTHVLTARTFDNHGATATSVAVTVIVNAAPTVSLTSPTNNAVFLAPATIQLTATAADSDGTIARVEFLDGTTVIGSDTTSPYSFTYANVAAGTHVLTARTFDNHGATATSVAVTVIVNAAPTASLTSPANNAVFLAPATITLNASATDSDGTIARVEFLDGTTMIGSDTTSPYSFTYANVTAGTHVLTARTFDNHGGTATSAAVNVIVNSAPTVSLTSPTNNAVFLAPATIHLTATAADSDGTIARVEFLDGTTVIGSDTTSPYSFTYANVTAGTRVLTARTFDNHGATATSAAVTVVVNAPNQSPTVQFTEPTNNAVFEAGANITLTATANDPDGRIDAVEFYFGGTLLGRATNTPYSITWSNVAAGDYLLLARAVDNEGAVGISPHLRLQVIAPTIPLAGPVSITSIQAFPNERTSTDPPGNAIDGNPNTYTWSTESGSTASPSYLAVGFTNSAIHRLRLWKSRDGGGGGDVKNLDIQYTVETNTPLSDRAWLNVRRLTNGFGGVELMNASAVNLDGSVTGDIHESASSGYASLTFEAVAATGLRIAFSDSSGGGFNHYRVGEIQVFSPGVVLPLAPSVDLTSPTNGARFSAPANITLTATASDLYGTVARVEFVSTLGPILGSDSSAPYSFTVTNLPPGLYGFRAVAYDNTGLSNRSVAVVITVVITNNPPGGFLATATTNRTFTAPAFIAVVVNANDSDGTVTNVEFYAGAQKLGENPRPPYSFVWVNAPQGAHALTAVVHDNSGLRGTSGVVDVTVRAPLTQITNAAPDPGNLLSLRFSNNEEFYFTVTGATSGSVWGTDVYTDDSSLATAAVHAGALTNGQRGIVKVTILPGQESYAASTRNGVPSSSWSGFAGSFGVAFAAQTTGQPPVITQQPQSLMVSQGVSATFSVVAPGASTYQWRKGGSPIPGAAQATFSIASVALADAGDYVVVAFNSFGSVTSQVARLTVVVGNLPPTVRIISPTNNSTFTVASSFILSADARDSNGTVTNVDYFTPALFIGSVNNPTFSLRFQIILPGTYLIFARATDNTGLMSTSAPVQVTVTAAPTHTVTTFGSLQTQAAPRFNPGDGYFWTMTTLGFDAVGKIRVGEAVTIVDAEVGGGGGATPYTMTILTGIGSKGTIALYDCNFGGTWFFYDAATGAKRSLPLGATPNLGANQCTLNAAAGVAANASGTQLYHHVGANIHEINPANGASVVIVSDERLGVANALSELKWDPFTGTLLGHGQDSTGKNHLYRIDPTARTVVEVSVPLTQWTWTVPDPDTGLLYLDEADRVHQFNPATGRLDTLSFTAGSFHQFSTFGPDRSGQGSSLYGTVSASGNQTLVEIAGTFPFTSGGGQQPTLAIQLLTDGRVVLSWPAEAAGFVLQTTTTVAAPASWQAVTDTPVSANGRLAITNSPPTRTQFYRLIKTN